MKDSAFLQGVHHAYAKTDGTYGWPNSRDGDLLREGMKEIAELRTQLDRDNQVIRDLAALAARLATQLRKANPDSSLPDLTVDYLRRNGLAGSPLREVAEKNRNEPTT